MHSSMTFVNAAGVAAGAGKPALERPKSKDEHQAEQELREETVSEPGGFDNDPDEPTDPNEVRERHLKKLKP